MTYGELETGTLFAFGRRNVKNSTYVPGRGYTTEELEKPILWKKTALDGLAVGLSKDSPYRQFDYPHSITGTNRYMRSHGHRLFFLTSLYRYLNCADASWKKVESGDNEPYGDGDGFLSHFTDKERSLIQPHEMKVTVPPGYVKQFGETLTRSVMVGIPSAEQVGTKDQVGTFGLNMIDSRTWLADADSLCKGWILTFVERIPGDTRNNFMPVIKIRDDAPVEFDPDIHKYIIRIPETPFTGDIDRFLGIDLEQCA